MNRNPAKQRKAILERAIECLGARVNTDWNWRQGPIGPVDLVPFVGGRPFRELMTRDFRADSGGYRKLGGSANTPASAYFFRRYANLLHLLKRQGSLMLTGDDQPAPGMVVVLDWPAQRGRFNFSPDRMGILLEVSASGLAVAIPMSSPQGWTVGRAKMVEGSSSFAAIVGFADLPF